MDGSGRRVGNTDSDATQEGGQETVCSVDHSDEPQAETSVQAAPSGTTGSEISMDMNDDSGDDVDGQLPQLHRDQPSTSRGPAAVTAVHSMYDVISKGSKFYKKFHYTGTEICVKFHAPPVNLNLQGLEAYIKKTFSELLLGNLFKDANDDTLVGVQISHPSLDSPIGLHFRKFVNFKVDDLLDLIKRVQQSKKSFQVDQEFFISSDSLDLPSGAGRDKLCLRGKVQSLVSIKNGTDKWCLPRALVVAQVRWERGELRSGPKHQFYEKFRKPASLHQKVYAKDIIEKAGVIILERGCGIEEIEKFQSWYAEKHRLAIMVYESGKIGEGETPFFDGCRYMSRRFMARKGILNILFSREEQHFDVITSMTGICMTDNFCDSCNIGFKRISSHVCPDKCRRCKGSPACAVNENFLRCDDCRLQFYGEECRRKHKLPNSFKKDVTVCNAIRRCEKCNVLKKIDKPKHKCYHYYCNFCCQERSYNHRCFIKKATCRDPKKVSVAYIFYDFEAMQERPLPGGESVNIHEVNYGVAQTVCSACIDREFGVVKCDICRSEGSKFFDSNNTVEQFVEYVIEISKIGALSKVICIAHNSKSYDGKFVLRYLVNRKNLKPKVILTGSKIMSMTIGKIKFIDSLNYFQMPLSALPKAFGLTGNIKKGFFPHFFNKTENQDYRGPLPDKKFYSPDTMSEAGRKQFLEWYTEQQNLENYVFDFRTEMRDYCENDVDILRRACLEFRKIFIEVAEMCPFFESTTIAAACMQVFRSKFLEPDTIGIIPPGGYRHGAEQSQQALKWLILEEKTRGVKIQHAGRGSEFRVEEGLYVDGYYQSENGKKFVFEFMGCFWHGCPRCYSDDAIRSQNYFGKTLNDKYRSTVEKLRLLRSKKYTVIEMWECSFKKLLEESLENKEYVENHPLLSKSVLDPRDAFYGGRTENMVNYVEAGPNERIEYTDICSLYPFVNKTAKYPVKHPQIFVGRECEEVVGQDNNIESIEGLIKCSVLPPRDLLQPVLPYRANNKLLFSLCRKCCKESVQRDCFHENEEDRVLVGTWVSDELKKAVSLGYVIREIFEIWKYETIQYNPLTNSPGLFEKYIRTFLKYKQEASGYPTSCADEESKKKYRDEFYEREGVRLDEDKISKNPGLRSVAKLCLNCFWGKFGQKENLAQSKFIDTCADLAKLVTDEKVDIMKIIPISDEMLYVNYRSSEDFIKCSPMTNVVLAAYTTAHARLKLYSYLERLQERVYYCDTDSCVWLNKVNNEEDYRVPIGSFLGDMTDELASFGEGSFIKSFVAAGPKFYALQVQTPGSKTLEEICKVKGITLNYATRRDKINFDSVKSLVSGETEKIEVTSKNIRSMEPHVVVTREEKKICRVTSNKRRFIRPDFSLPYGFKRRRLIEQ